MEIVKWWKNKPATILVITLVLTVIFGGLGFCFIPKPYNFMVLCVLIIACAIISQIQLNKIFDNIK